jgi:nickel ABC transporter permease subunit NikC
VSSNLELMEPQKIAAGEGSTLLRDILKDRLAVIGLLIVTLIVAAGLLAPLLAPHDPLAVAIENRLAAPSRAYPLGTDFLGRCILSRLLYGTRVTLSTATLSLLSIVLISIPVGLISGYRGGWLDNLLMRIVDVFLAFPYMILSLVIAGMLGPGLTNVMLSVAAVWWVTYARVVRGIVLSLKEKEFVMAARASGTPEFLIIIRHILPNALSVIVVLGTLDMGKLILIISGLSFLGLGAQPPTPEWGQMLNEGRPYLQLEPQIMIFPGLAIMMTVMGFNLLGDALRDLLDPRS